ncbi:MAG: mechanosensitive ion channel family protein [Bacteroidales bacterium]
MYKRLFILLLVIVLRPLLVLSQENSVNDTINAGLQNQTEASILYQQQKLDSLIRIKLQDELVKASGNQQKTKELEEKLNIIEFGDSMRKVELLLKIESIRKNAHGFAVNPFSDTLFFIYSNVASLSAKERAENIKKRIKALSKEPFLKPDSLKVRQAEYGVEIMYSDGNVILVVTNVDALLLNTNELQLATKYREVIRKSLIDERKANNLTNLSKRIGLVILIIFGLSLLIILNNKVFIWIKKWLLGNHNWFLKGLTIKKVKIFSSGQLGKFVIRVINFLRIILIFLAIFLSLPLLFSLFPETKMWTSTLLNWILSPARTAFNGVIGFMPNLFSILVIIFIFKYSIKGIKYFVDQIDNGQIQISGFHEEWALPTFRILKFLLFAFMLVLVFPYLPGSGSPAFQGVSVFVGVLFSLGSSSAIANMVAGMVITYMRPFKIGDRVKIGEITGDVVEKTSLVTRIRTIKNEDVTVPNSTVLLSSTTNYSTNTRDKDTGLIMHTTVTIGYDAPWKDVHTALISAALRTTFILKNPSPFVLQTSLDDFYVSYQINCYTKEANKQATIYSDLHRNIQDCFNEAGIEIMSPHYEHQRRGNATAIPSNYLVRDDNGYNVDDENVEGE